MSPELAAVIITAIAGVAGIIIAAIIKSIKEKSGNCPAPIDKTPVHERCIEHSGLEAEVNNVRDDTKELRTGQTKIWGTITKIQETVGETNNKISVMELNILKEIKKFNGG